jgi:hypothetical protein
MGRCNTESKPARRASAANGCSRGLIQTKKTLWLGSGRAQPDRLISLVGSIVGSTAWVVLHRPVELAAFIGSYSQITLQLATVEEKQFDFGAVLAFSKL